MAKPFFYIIPRTSSTSLTNYLKASFGEDKVFVRKVVEDVFDNCPVTATSPTPSLQRLKEDLTHTDAYRAFVVMAPFGVHKFINDELDLYVTLREPADRCKSLIRFMQAKPDLNQINAMVASYGDDLPGMLKERSLICLRNEQTRMLGNAGDWSLTDTHLEVARSNLANFASVFDFKDFGRQLPQIISRYAAAPPPDFPWLNAAPKRISLSQSHISHLERANDFDRRLYRSITQEPVHAA